MIETKNQIEEYIIVDENPKSVGNKQMKYYNHKKDGFFGTVMEGEVFHNEKTANRKLDVTKRRYPNKKLILKPLSEIC